MAPTARGRAARRSPKLPSRAARRVTTTTEEVIPAPGPEDVEESLIVERDPEEPMDELSALPGTGFVKIYRMKPGGEKAFLRRMERSDVADNLEEVLKKNWGSGDFLVEVYKRDERGQVKWERKLEKVVDYAEGGPPKGAATETMAPRVEEEFHYDPPYAPDPNAPPPAAPPTGATGLMALVVTLQQGNQQLVAQMQSQSQEHSKQMLASAERQTSLLIETMKLNAPKSPNMDDTLRAAEIMTKGKGVGDEVVKLLIQRGLGDEGSSRIPAGANDSLVERVVLALVNAAGPALAAVLPRLLAAQGQRPPQGPRPVAPPPAAPALAAPVTPPTPAAEVAPPATEAVAEPPAPELVVAAAAADPGPQNGHAQEVSMTAIVKSLPMYKLAAAAIVAMAEGGMDADEAAGRIDAIAGEDNHATIEALIVLPDEVFIATLAEYEPTAPNHREWLLKVKAAVDRLYKEQEAEPAGSE